SPTCSTSTTVVTTLQQNPGIGVVKSVTSSGPYNTVGQAITYQFVVTNTGNVTLSGVTVTDSPTLTTGPTCVSLSNPGGSCSGSTVASLAPGQSATFTGTYNLTQADLNRGSVSDAGTACGTAPGASSPTCSTSTTVVTTLQQNPGIGIVKSVTSSGPYNTVGQAITYQFVVTNTGNVTLSNVGVTDAPTLTTGPTCVSLSNPGG